MNEYILIMMIFVAFLMLFNIMAKSFIVSIACVLGLAYLYTGFPTNYWYIGVITVLIFFNLAFMVTRSEHY